MRIHTLAGLALFAVLNSAAAAMAAENDWHLMPGKTFQTGPGATAGMSGQQAAWVMGRTNARYTTTHNASTAIARTIPLEEWRGKRVRVTLRLKPEGKLYGWTSLSLTRSDRTGSTTDRRRTDFGGGEWETIPFVLEVPETATKLWVDVGLSGEGKVWVDEIGLEAVGPDVALSNTRRAPGMPSAYNWNQSWGPSCSYNCNTPDNAFANPINPYAGWAQSTINDLRASGSLRQ